MNGSGQFIGVAKMISEVNFTEKFAQWLQDGKWMGKFKVEWVFIKDIPNREFKSIIVPTNENKPVTNMRDAQEVPYAQGMTMLKTFRSYNADSCVLDEFEHYDNDETRRKESRVSGAVEPFGKINYEGSQRGRGRGRGRARGRGRRPVDPAIESATIKAEPAKPAAAPATNNA